MEITKNIKIVKKALENQEIVVIPTETVYGLAGNALDSTTVKKIFELKKRPSFNPLIVHIKSMEYMSKIAKDIPSNAMKLAEKFWPGPLTLILPKKECIPNEVTSGKNTVAVRIPNHSITLELLNQLSFPLAAPSANPFGSISPTKTIHVANYFEHEKGFILDGGDCEKGIESTIVAFEGEKVIILRRGAIATDDIKKVVGEITVSNKNNEAPDAPGMLLKHYAPKTNMLLTNNINELLKHFKDKKIGLLLYCKSHPDDHFKQEILSIKGDMEEAAKNLYNAMHTLDNCNLDLIIAERLPDHGLGKSINDRLERAVTH